MIHDVIIIGAGVSGLAAAKKLIDKGLKVLILESTNRIGGRIKTDMETFGFPLDLGGGWIHGSSENILGSFAKEFKIPLWRTHNFGVYALVEDSTSYGTRIPQDISDAIVEAVESRFVMMEKETASSLPLSKESEYSIADYLRDNAAQLMRLPEGVPTQVSGISSERLLFDLWTNSEEYGAAPLNKAALHGTGVDHECEGDHYLLPNGYSEFIRKIVGPEPYTKVKVNQRVKRIQDNKDTFIVSVEGGESYNAFSVLVTVPLGVLKADKISFEPPLPNYKRSAISKIGFGSFAKVILEFTTPFWPADSEYMTILPFEINDLKWKNYKEGKPYISTGNIDEHPLLLINLYEHSKRPILISIIDCERAKELEADPDSCVKKILERIKIAFGVTREVVTPIKTVVTSWNSDPDFMGAFSFVQTGSTGAEMDDLSKEIPFGLNRGLFFAGEATYSRNFGTVQAAFLSGLREAEKIINKGCFEMDQQLTFLNSLSSEVKDAEIRVLLSHLSEFYTKKLWHQVGETLIALTKLRAASSYLPSIYSHFVDGLVGSKLSPNRYALFVIAVASALSSELPKAIFFLNEIFLKLKPTCVPSSCLVLAQAARLKLASPSVDLADVRADILSLEDLIDSFLEENSQVTSSFYQLAAEYSLATANFSSYFKNALLHLSCCSLDEMNADDKLRIATNLAVAALLGDEVYKNFGMLLQHPILNELPKGSFLVNLLFAFNSGNISVFESSMAQIQQHTELGPKTDFLRQKISLMALVQLIFNSPINERTFSFDTIAQATSVPLNQVEHLIMKALSLDLVRGSIDEIAKAFSATWVLPRALNIEQISSLRDRFLEWQTATAEAAALMKIAGSPEIIPA